MTKDELLASLDDFTTQYLETALWAETDPDTEEPLDDRYDIADFTVAALREAKRDCDAFRKQAQGAFMRAGLGVRAYNVDSTQAGHDFWLTRNGHGAGFWDRGLGEVGRVLTDVAQSFGSVDVWPNGRGGLNFFNF